MSLTVPTLAADRYRLRPFGLGDTHLIREASDDPYIPTITSVPPSFTEAEGRAYIERQWSRSSEDVGYPWAIAEATSDRAVGFIALWPRDQNGNQGDRRASIGYWVVASARGRGAASHAVAAVTHFAFRSLQIHRLELHIEPWNTPSIRTAERAGFTREELVPDWEQPGCEPKDVWRYSRLEDDADPATSPPAPPTW